jgi:hypothetical protein
MQVLVGEVQEDNVRDKTKERETRWYLCRLREM